MTFTLACVMVRGKRPSERPGKRHRYTGKWVQRLRSMVERNTDRPFRMVCLTDQPEEMPEGVEAVVVPNPDEGRGWWAKMHLFDPRMPFNGRVLYLDLDVVILGDLAPIIDFPANFAICAEAPGVAWQGKDGLRVIKRYNSSCMVWNHRARQRFFHAFKPEWRKEVWSDQDAIALMSPNEATFPQEWVVRVRPDSYPFDPAVKLGLCIKWKNNKLARETEWFERLWVGC